MLATVDVEVGIGSITVCRGLNLRLEPGRIIGVLGRNGIGKTTLLLSLAGLFPVRRGHVLLAGQPLRTLPRRNIAQRVGILFQSTDDPFPSTVFETVLTGRHPHVPTWQGETARDRHIAESSLAAVGLVDLRARSTHTLSGGERRRLAFATLLTQQPACYLLDEPTNHLDLHHQIALLDYLKNDVRTHRRSAIMVLHDINLAARYCDDILMLFGEGIHIQGKAQTMLTPPRLHRLYGHPIIALQNGQTRAFLPG